jgi:phospholipid/cholesterol/gamma-HCH transport system substrate-binding protein
MNVKAGCREPAAQSNPRGPQNLSRAGAAYRAPVASFDPDSGKLRWGGRIDPALAQPGTLAPQAFGEESWKWLFLQPLVP